MLLEVSRILAASFHIARASETQESFACQKSSTVTTRTKTEESRLVTVTDTLNCLIVKPLQFQHSLY